MAISKIKEAFNSQAGVFVTYATANAERLDIDAAIITDITAKLTAWNTTFALYINPNTRTSPVIHNLDTLYVVFRKLLNDIKQSLKNNISITLTDDDYDNLGIHKDKTTKTPAPIPNKALHIDVLLGRHLTREFEVALAEAPFIDHTNLPPNVSSIGIKLAYKPVADTTPVTDADYHDSRIVTKVRFELLFEETYVGMKAYMIVWALNSRGEKGPNSEVATFIIE